MMAGLILMLAVVALLALYVYSRIRSIKDDESIYMSTDAGTCRDVHAHLWINGACPLGCKGVPEPNSHDEDKRSPSPFEFM